MKKKNHRRKKAKRCYKLDADMTREILYSNLKICKYYDNTNNCQKVDKLKTLFNLQKFPDQKENINIFLNNIYKSAGYGHLNIKHRRLKRALKYKNNVDYRLIEHIMENDKFKKLTLKDITQKYNENNATTKISITKLWSHIRQLGYKYVKLNTLNRQVLTENSKESQKAVINFLTNKILDGNLIFYVDECPLSKNIKKTKGFIKNSVKINNAIGNERIKRTTLIYIIGNNGMYYYTITPDIVNARAFWKFIHEAIIFFNKMLNSAKN